MSKLYLVEVWPGHWDDVTLRARRVIREVVLIVVEDADGARGLLEEHEIHVPTLDIHVQGMESCLQAVLDGLRDGDVAWLSGGPTRWARPAHALVAALLERGVELVPIPGPTAAIAGLVVSGQPADRFLFLGELPSSSAERRTVLDGAALERHTLVCSVEGAHLAAAMRDIEATLGDRHVALCRDRAEWQGPSSQAPALYTEGLLTLIIQGAEAASVWTEEEVREQVRAALERGESPRDAARKIAVRSGWSRRRVYRIAIEREED
ncbi:MAG: hypothetical protein ISS56_11995 [Anaerolineae bacterium]|nr:hypothetical protein [Anaerolineae bacterium]